MTCIVVGIDASATADRVINYSKRLAKMLGDCEIVLAYIIEWSPYSFHTPEELAARHARREHEIEQARDYVLTPAARSIENDGLKTTTIVRHGDTTSILNEIAVEKSAEMIVVGRSGEHGLRSRIFGSVAGNLTATATVPVTIIP